MAKESLIVRQWANETVEELDQRTRAITLAVLRSVVYMSPVLSGRFRGNWQVSVGFPIEAPIERLDKDGGTTLAVESGNVGGAGTVTFINNNVPYSEVIEYGQYPNPPKRGTWVKAAGKGKRRVPGHFEINTIGGYSTQEPAGVVRVTMARIQELIRESGKGS